MSIDERLFGWLHRTVAQLRARPPEVGPHALTFDALASRLALLATALAEEAIELRVAEDLGGVRGATMLLPALVDRQDSVAGNLEVYVHRVAYGVHSRALGFCMDGLGAEDRTLATVLAAVATRAAVAEELPACVGLLARVRGPGRPGPMGSLLFGDPVPAAGPSWLRELMRDPPRDQAALVHACARLAHLRPELEAAAAPDLILFGQLMSGPKPLGRTEAPGQEAPVLPSQGASERPAPARDEVEVVELPPRPEDENPLVHSFEKVHTLDDYKGGNKREDGEDQLDEQLAALDELDLRQVIRTGETANSVYRLDDLFGGGAGELDAGSEEDRGRAHLRYDEWDGREGGYRPGWCTLHLERAPEPAAAEVVAARVARVRRAHARQRRELRAALEALELERRWRARQLDGPELDLDAVVDRRAEIAAGYNPEPRIYAARRRHVREVATLILLDLSLSSDSFVDNRRILDVSQDALLVLGEVLDQARDHFAVAGFFSHTRRDCRWLTLKSFETPWTEALPRLLAVQPQGYTRIGPALRHGIQALSDHPARRRLLLLVTDGRPTDYDHYEGRHGVEDVRQAFREAEGAGIHPFAITVAERATPILPRLFGTGRFETLASVDGLARVMTEVYTRLAR